MTGSIFDFKICYNGSDHIGLSGFQISTVDGPSPAISPSPTDDASGISVNVDLSWADGVDGSLSNGGEKPQISQPGDLDGTGRFCIRVDRVNYSDGSHPVDDDPWPVAPDGGGQSLTRITPSNYGNDIANWKSSSPTPGS